MQKSAKISNFFSSFFKCFECSETKEPRGGGVGQGLGGDRTRPVRMQVFFLLSS